eukprot:gene20965-27820_t
MLNVVAAPISQVRQSSRLISNTSYCSKQSIDSGWLSTHVPPDYAMKLPRADWLTVNELCNVGVEDGTVLTHCIMYNRSKRYPLILRIPPTLLSPFMLAVPEPLGLTHWQMIEVQPIQPQAGASSAGSGSEQTRGNEGGGADADGATNGGAGNGDGAATSAELTSRERAKNVRAGDGAAASAASAEGVCDMTGGQQQIKCSLSSCGLTESSQTGVRLLSCACHALDAMYCCIEHQREAWKTHKLACPHAVKRNRRPPQVARASSQKQAVVSI